MGGQKEKNVKRILHKLKFRHIKTWILVVILIPLLFIDATLLRLDHKKMVELRDDVLAADQSGDVEYVAMAMDSLRDFTFSHIAINVVDNNGAQKIEFGTGVFYLETLYKNAATAALEQAEASSDSNPNGNIYAAASATCKPRAIAHGWSWDDQEFINCMTSEIQKYPAADTLSEQLAASLPSTELYRHNYASPIWAPSLSGFMILFTIIMIVVIFIRFIKWLVLRIAILFL